MSTVDKVIFAEVGAVQSVVTVEFDPDIVDIVEGDLARVAMVRGEWVVEIFPQGDSKNAWLWGPADTDRTIEEGLYEVVSVEDKTAVPAMSPVPSQVAAQATIIRVKKIS
jgi:hypothetical protein